MTKLLTLTNDNEIGFNLPARAQLYGVGGRKEHAAMTKRSSLRSPELRAVTVLVLAAVVLLVFGVLQHRAAAAEAPTVIIDNYMFMSETLTIPVGSSITWVNHDSEIHTVAADDGSPVMFKSPGMDTDDKFTFTFTKAGNYLYHCSLHPHMIGKIVVQ